MNIPTLINKGIMLDDNLTDQLNNLKIKTI